MSESALAFLIFWCVWITIPIVVDGVETLSRLITVFFSRLKKKPFDLSKETLPYVSVIIPAHNEAAIIDRCLNALKIQDYPHERLEVIVVDDGSTDGTQEKVKNHINGLNNGKNGSNGLRINGKFVPVGDFSGVVKLHAKPHTGKAEALNTGIISSHGEIIINIDSDVVLAPDALRKMVEAFVKDPLLGAATGNIEINPEIIEEKDEEGNLVLDEKGEPLSKKLSSLERFLAFSQFLEYLSAFRLGREAQAATGTLYTLSGAFSAFRRDVLFKSSLYKSRTVSEDTDLTLDLHRQPVKIGYVSEAKAYLEPVIEWDELYAQRVRWSRGQLEVCGIHKDICRNFKAGLLGFFGLPKMLTVDHTLAFPRLIWTLMLPFFVLFGYSSQIILTALVLMYGFYVFIELVNVLASYLVSDTDTRREVEKTWFYCFFLPLYRFIVFHFRMSGYLSALKEPPAWSVPGPVNGLKNGVKNLQQGLSNGLAVFLANFKVGEEGGLENLVWSEFSLNLKGKLEGLAQGLYYFFLLPIAWLVLWKEKELNLPSWRQIFFSAIFRKLKEVATLLSFFVD